MSRDASFPLLLLCFFLSGLAGLIYETAWTREFAFVFGTSNLAVATVLAAYMGGLAAGAGLAARFADRIRRPVLAYGVLELGVGLAALAVPFAVRGAQALYVALLGGQPGLPDTGGLPTALFYLACSFVILMVPTAMMGATLPLLARHAVQREEQLGSRIGLLYAINTAGAVAGTLLAAFVLLPELGLRRTIWAAAAVNGAVFLAAWALARSTRAAPPPTPAHVGPRGAASWILPLMFGSGIASFTYEVMWVRLLEHVLGGSVYAFATMLASFLAGIALGSAAGSRLARTRRGATLGFALAQLAIGVLSLAAFIAVGWVPELTLRLGEGLSAHLVQASSSMLTLFPAALAIGATFPLAVRALARDETDAGTASARVYAWNTLGSIVGAVGAGFFIVPALGFVGTITAAVGLNLLLAGAATLLLAPRRPALALAVGACVVWLASIQPGTPWRVLRNSALTGRAEGGDIEYFGVGRAATVLLLQSGARWYLRTNGLPESSIDPPGIHHNRTPVARWLGALPVLARPEARSLAVVGFGGGVALESVPSSVERIHVIELEPEVVEANRAVSGRRWRDPLADPRVRVHLNDARNALLLTDERFDAIVSQPSHPWSAGASHLYTHEFFDLARSRLADDGVFVQWIGFGFVDELLFRSLVATLNAVFEYVRVYYPAQGGALFLASDAQLDVERTAGEALAATPSDFAELGLVVPDDVTMWLLLDEEGTRAVGSGAPINRDAHNLLQSRSPRILGAAIKEVDPLLGAFDPLPGSLPPGADPFYLVERLPLPRALRLARSLGDTADRRVAMALIEMRRGARESARGRLLDVLWEDPFHEVARGALLRASEQVRNEGDPLLLLQGPLSATEQALVDGWRARGSTAELRALEPTLAAIPPRHPLAPHANRLRMEWRIQSGDVALALEARDLADRAMWDRSRPGDALLRAQACVAAGDPRGALDTLAALGRGLGQTQGAQAVARAALALVRSISPTDEAMARLQVQTQTILSRLL